MALDEQEVFHQLNWGWRDWSWFGISMGSLGAAMGLPAVYLFFAAWSDMPLGYAVPLALASLATILILQWKQPAGWVQRYLDNAGIPQHLDHFQHVQHPPFPVAREDLL